MLFLFFFSSRLTKICGESLSTVSTIHRRLEFLSEQELFGKTTTVAEISLLFFQAITCIKRERRLEKFHFFFYQLAGYFYMIGRTTTDGNAVLLFFQLRSSVSKFWTNFPISSCFMFGLDSSGGVLVMHGNPRTTQTPQQCLLLLPFRAHQPAGKLAHPQNPLA